MDYAMKKPKKPAFPMAKPKAVPVKGKMMKKPVRKPSLG
jgi:hypothetical protein